MDEDPFPPVASINSAIFNLRALIESKKAGKFSLGKVWVPKYCPVRVDRLKKEWVVVCIDPPSRRNSMKGIRQGTKQYNQFSMERKFPPKGKMNSLEDEFVPPREKVVKRPTSPWVGSILQGRMIQAGSKNVPKETEPFLQGVSSLLQRVGFYPKKRKLQTTSLFQGKRQGKNMFLKSCLFFQDVEPVLQDTE